MKRPSVAHVAALVLFLTAACYPQIYTESRTLFDVEETKSYDTYVVSPYPATPAGSVSRTATSGATINIYNVAPYSSSQSRQGVALWNYPTYYPSNPYYNNGYYGNSLVYGTSYYGSSYAYPVGSYGSTRLMVGSPGFGMNGYPNGYGGYAPSNRNRNRNAQRSSNVQRQYRQQNQNYRCRGWRRH